MVVQKMEELKAEMEAAKEEGKLLEHQLAIIEHITSDELTRELELDALLDAKIDRLIKRLLHLKAAKQIIRGSTEPSVASRPAPRLLPSCAT